jgi:hypothetical protein
MRSTNPPALATWLLQRFGAKEALVGDLVEQYRKGRSAGWYWRQTMSGIISSFATEAWQHKALAIGVVAFGAYLPHIYMFIVRPRWLARLDGWYPHLRNWLFRMDLDGIWRLTVHLQLYFLTARITLCAFLAAVAWIMSRLRPRQRGLVLTLFLVSQVGLGVPHIGIAFKDWLGEPGNPIWFFDVLWSSVFKFIAIPFSILVGGLCGQGLHHNGPDSHRVDRTDGQPLKAAGIRNPFRFDLWTVLESLPVSSNMELSLADCAANSCMKVRRPDADSTEMTPDGRRVAMWLEP